MSTTLAPTYGSRTEFTTGSPNLASLASGTARPLGKVDNSALSPHADGFKIDLTIPLAASGVAATGTITLYLIEAAQDTTTTYTDGINPAGTADVTAALKNARPLRTYTANANSQVVQDSFTLPTIDAPKYWALVIANGTGAAFAATGATAGYTPINYTNS